MNISDAWDNGHNFNNKITSPTATVYFPAAGRRDYNTGSLRSVGIGGYYWSAIRFRMSRACSLYFTQWSVTSQHENSARADGCSVRPVAEQ